MALDRNGVIAKVRGLMEVPPTYIGLKEKAEKFLRAVGTAQEKPMFYTLIEEIKADVTTIDELIRLTESPEGIALFGEKKAGKLNIIAKDAKQHGEDTCVCPACQACKEILANQAAIAS